MKASGANARMAKNAIRLEIQLTGFSSRVDGSLGFRGVTPEMNSEEKVSLMELQGLLVEALFIPKDEKDAELVEVKGEMDVKTPSQRLRSVLFCLFKEHQKKGIKETFDTFYARYMERLIELVKTKLDPEK